MLRRALHRRGLSQAELAARAGLSEAAVSQAVNGRPVRGRTAQRLAAALAQETRPRLEEEDQDLTLRITVALERIAAALEDQSGEMRNGHDIENQNGAASGRGARLATG